MSDLGNRQLDDIDFVSAHKIKQQIHGTAKRIKLYPVIRHSPPISTDVIFLPNGNGIERSARKRIPLMIPSDERLSILNSFAFPSLSTVYG